MNVIGPIVRLQVQRSSLKVGERPRRRYDPGPLTAVTRLTLDADGAVGWTEEGEAILDVHNQRHPDTKNREENPLSVGFTGHYELMRERFGEVVTPGIAGENIVIESGAHWTERDLADGLAILTAAGETIRLDQVIVADPCVEFSRYLLRFPEDARPDGRVTEALRFLGEGMRGFYVRCPLPSPTIAIGDHLVMR